MARRGERVGLRRTVLAVLVAAAAFLGGRTAGTGSLAASTTAPQQSEVRALSSWDSSASPQYYRVVGPALVDQELQPGQVSYSDLDLLGRAGQAAAEVTPELMEEGTARKRQSMEGLEPSGWGHNEEVDIPSVTGGKAYHGAFWNRSHLVAKSLGGAERIENLVTGTRMQNVGEEDGGGMAYCEGLARDWLSDHPEGTLYYSATPVYRGTELVPRSVFVDMRSSDGTLDLEVEVYNAALGYTIDYATGSFAPSK